jgi:hypothetical protein
MGITRSVKLPRVLNEQITTRQLVATTTNTTKESKNQRLELSALRDAPVCSSEVVARYLSSPPLTDLEQQNGVIVKKIAAEPLHAIRHRTRWAAEKILDKGNDLL